MTKLFKIEFLKMYKRFKGLENARTTLLLIQFSYDEQVLKNIYFDVCVKYAKTAHQNIKKRKENKET